MPASGSSALHHESSERSSSSSKPKCSGERGGRRERARKAPFGKTNFVKDSDRQASQVGRKGRRRRERDRKEGERERASANHICSSTGIFSGNELLAAAVDERS